MRTFRALLAVTDLYELVRHTRFSREGADRRRRLLSAVEDLELCFHDLDDAAAPLDDRLRLEDALTACQRANQLLAELRQTGGWTEPEIARADELLAHAGRYVCDELLRREPLVGRRSDRFQ